MQALTRVNKAGKLHMYVHDMRHLQTDDENVNSKFCSLKSYEHSMMEISVLTEQCIYNI